MFLEVIKTDCNNYSRKNSKQYESAAIIMNALLNKGLFHFYTWTTLLEFVDSCEKMFLIYV